MPPTPVAERWYRDLLATSLVLGAAAGVLGLAYLGITGGISDALFGEDPRIDAWSGDWWWILLTALGGVIIVELRHRWHTSETVPGGVAMIESGVVDHRLAPSWIALALVSAIAGASLGPSFAMVTIGGGVASWVASRRWPGDERARLDATMSGVAGGLGGTFTAPVMGALLVSELEPTPRARYVEAIIPQLIAATVAFAIYFAAVGTTFLNSFAIPADEFSLWHVALGVALGVLASFTMIVFAIIVKSMQLVAAKAPHRYVRGLVGGALVGFIAFALPLTLGSGNDQLTEIIDNSATISTWLLVAVLLGKMLAMAVSLATGFIGGNVLPMLFVGGTTGVTLHILIPDLPYAVTVGCMLAAVPGAYIRSPLGLTVIAALTIGLGPVTAVPVAVAVVTANLFTAGVVAIVGARRAALPATHT